MLSPPKLIEELTTQSAYPEDTRSIEVVQTRISYVFMTGDHVYKIKKPVDLGYLDYTSLDDRLYYCEREVELNRRLCPDIYLGVVPITRLGNRLLVEGHEGQTVEFAVKMRRLPREMMLNALIARDEATPEMMVDVADKLADFHAQAATNSTISAFGGVGTVLGNVHENFEQTKAYTGVTLSQEKYDRISRFTLHFIREHGHLFRERVNMGKIRDCHGDLHAEHICFTDGICIYDCIEFNDRFRYGDVVSEVAFLAMDLEHFGRADLSRSFILAYGRASSDPHLNSLLKFYKCYRAYVRGKVESMKLSDPDIGVEERRLAVKEAQAYFDLADFYTNRMPVLLITAGLIASGKSTIASLLARRYGLYLLRSDVVRKKLAGISPRERRFEQYDKGIYSPGFTRMTYDHMVEEAGNLLEEGHSVIIDASFMEAVVRERAVQVADSVGAGFRVLECRADYAVLLERLARRMERGDISDGRPEILQYQKEVFEPVRGIPEAMHVVLDTSKTLEEMLGDVDERMPRSPLPADH